MSIPLRYFVKTAAKRIVTDPKAREKTVNTARTVTEEAKQIYRDEDRARAAGKAVRRAWKRFQSEE